MYKQILKDIKDIYDIEVVDHKGEESIAIESDYKGVEYFATIDFDYVLEVEEYDEDDVNFHEQNIKSVDVTINEIDVYDDEGNEIKQEFTDQEYINISKELGKLIRLG